MVKWENLWGFEGGVCERNLHLCGEMAKGESCHGLERG